MEGPALTSPCYKSSRFLSILFLVGLGLLVSIAQSGFAQNETDNGGSNSAGGQPAEDTQPSTDKFDKHLLLVVGAAGEKPFGDQFDEWASQWREAVKDKKIRLVQIGGKQTQMEGSEPRGDDAVSDRDRIRNFFVELKDDRPVWIVLIGHGTFDGNRAAKFNLVGPDLSADALSGWMKSHPNQMVILNCASSSAPFINLLSGQNRIIVSSTKSGSQYNFSRFGQFLAEAISDPTIDLDKDGQISLLEMFLAASNRTQEFYKSQSRLATEHALLDDNADQLGTPADWFTGIRVTTRAKKGTVPDGPRANQVFLIDGEKALGLPEAARKQRNVLEMELEKLIAARTDYTEQEYLLQLEVVLLKIARLYEANGKPDADKPNGG